MGARATPNESRHEHLEHHGGDREATRRRLAPEERRAEILAAALAVFTELGFERATLQDVADRAGVTKGALYHYFESKDHLFIELVRSYMGELLIAGEARMAAADPARTRTELLEEHLREMWAALQRPYMIALSQLIMIELPNFPEIGRAFFDEVVLPARRMMRQILMRGAPPGARPSPEVETLIAAIPSMLLGAALSQHGYAAIDPLRFDAERLGRCAIRTLVHGALAATEPDCDDGGARDA